MRTTVCIKYMCRYVMFIIFCTGTDRSQQYNNKYEQLIYNSNIYIYIYRCITNIMTNIICIKNVCDEKTSTSLIILSSIFQLHY